MKSINQILANGETDRLVENLSLADYLALPHMSSSCVVTGQRTSLKHLKRDYETVATTTDPMRKGSLADSLLFDFIVPTVRNGGGVPDAVASFDECVPVFTGTRRGKKWDEFSEQHGEIYLNSYAERQDIVSMVTAIATDPVAAPYWRNGVAQTTLTMVEHGLLLKGRPDWVQTDGAIVDMKTTGRIHPRSLSRTTFDLGYNVKMAFYRRWWQRLTGQDKPCVLIFVEQSDPYDVVVVPIDPATLLLAEEKALKTLERVRQCIESGEWPGVAEGEEQPLEVPSWEMEEPEWV